MSYNRPPTALRNLFTACGPFHAVCRVCGAKVRRNALAYSGHIRGKQHQSAVTRSASPPPASP